MKTFKNPNGLKLKPCLNCVPTPKSRSMKVFEPLAHHNPLDFERICPCSNHMGEIHRENGKIVEFVCENRNFTSEATKIRLRKMGITQRGKKRPEKTRRKISEALKGIQRSQETKRKISGAMKGRLGTKCNSWKGGKAKHSEGYVLIYSPTHPHKECKGYVMEHHLVMEKHLGRFLLPTEVVHHINDIRDDNRIENLMLFNTAGEHICFHNKRKKMHEGFPNAPETHSKARGAKKKSRVSQSSRPKTR